MQQMEHMKFQEATGFSVKVEVRGLDRLGREMTASSCFDSIELVVAYIKLINVPCFFDRTSADPCPMDQLLSLTMIDEISFNEVLPEFNFEEEIDPRKIANMRTSIDALHHILDVSEVIITINGYSTLKDQKRYLYGSEARSEQRKKYNEKMMSEEATSLDGTEENQE